MATRRISVNVGGLWRTSVELKEKASWEDLKIEIEKVTGTWQYWQKLKPSDFNFERCKLEEGDDIFCDWESHGYIPLHHAAFAGNVEAIRSWIASGADVNATGLKQKTPLMCACVQSSEESVLELLQLGANVNAIDATGNTALYYITTECYKVDLKTSERIAKILIKAGCDPIIQNRNGDTFIDILKKRECREVATKLEEWIKETRME